MNGPQQNIVTDWMKSAEYCKGPFTNDVSREGEGGCPNSDAVRGGCVILVL